MAPKSTRKGSKAPTGEPSSGVRSNESLPPTILPTDSETITEGVVQTTEGVIDIEDDVERIIAEAQRELEAAERRKQLTIIKRKIRQAYKEAEAIKRGDSIVRESSPKATEGKSDKPPKDTEGGTP